MKLFSGNILLAALVGGGAGLALLAGPGARDGDLVAAWDVQRSLTTRGQALVGEILDRPPGEVLLLSIREGEPAASDRKRWVLVGEAPTAAGRHDAPRRFVATLEEHCGDLARPGCLELADLALPSPIESVESGLARAAVPVEPLQEPPAGPPVAPLVAVAASEAPMEPRPAPEGDLAPAAGAAEEELQLAALPEESAPARPPEPPALALPEPETEPETEPEPVAAQPPAPEAAAPPEPEAAAPDEPEWSPPDETVRQTQATLQRLGYQPGPADGLPGARTLAAIRAFQKNSGLAVTGKASEALLGLMRQNLAKLEAARGKAPATAGAGLPAAAPVARGAATSPVVQASGQLVLLVQDRLMRFGFKPLPRDGRLDAATRDAIGRYQQATGQPVTGLPTPALLEDMDRRLRKLSASN